MSCRDGAWPSSAVGRVRGVGGRTTAGALLAIKTGSGARVALVELEKDSADVVHGDVDGVGDTRDRKNTLRSQNTPGPKVA